MSFSCESNSYIMDNGSLGRRETEGRVGRALLLSLISLMIPREPATVQTLPKEFYYLHIGLQDTDLKVAWKAGHGGLHL